MQNLLQLTPSACVVQTILNYIDKDDKDYLVIELIERAEEASIRTTTTWGEHGSWTIDAIARKQGDLYTTSAVYPTAGSSPRSQQLSDFRASISIKIISRSERRLDIKGVWREQGEVYPFAGEVEKHD